MSQYIRVGKFKLEDVLPFTDKGSPPKSFAGKTVRMSSLRYRVFRTSGTKCVKCGIEGCFFALERDRHTKSEKSYHFNLYAIDENGHEVLMTKDHIIPKSRGGTDHISNLQTMCANCNNAKGSTIPGRKKYLWVSAKNPVILEVANKPKLGPKDILIAFKRRGGVNYFEELIFGSNFDFSTVLNEVKLGNEQWLTLLKICAKKTK